MDGRCETCMHWNTDDVPSADAKRAERWLRRRTLGACELARSSEGQLDWEPETKQEDESWAIALPEGDPIQDNVNLYTRSQFGCVRWESRDSS